MNRRDGMADPIVRRRKRGYLLRRSVVVFLACLAGLATVVSGFSFAEAASPKTTDVTTNVTVHMGEYYFTLSQTTAPVGTVVFTIINDGDVQHDFSIAGKTTPLMNHGQTVTLAVNFTDAKDYYYFCSVGEHAVYGMSGSFTVTGSGATTGTDKTTTAATPPPPKPVAIVRVAATEFKFTLVGTKNKTVKTYKKVKVKGKLVRKLVKVKTTRTVPHGLVRFIFTNKGHIAHNFAIAKNQTSVLAPRKSQVLDVKLSKGKYTYICTIRGHAAAGMKGQLVVT
jgi:uncharacterized cupredoxin-like copper-binding protein